MKVNQSECAQYGPSHYQQMSISKGGFEPSRCPQEVHCIYTFVFSPLFSQLLTLTCSDVALLDSHVHLSKKKKSGHHHPQHTSSIIKQREDGATRDLARARSKQEVRVTVHGSFLVHVLQQRPNIQECQGSATQLPDSSQKFTVGITTTALWSCRRPERRGRRGRGKAHGQ